MKTKKRYFAPDYEFARLLTTQYPFEIVEAYRKRILGYYINPAKHLVGYNAFTAFAVGILCFSAIDAIAEIESGNDDNGDRFKDWLKDSIPEFMNLEDRYLGRIYGEFRSGLVHNARISHGGYFTYDIDDVIEISKALKMLDILPFEAKGNISAIIDGKLLYTPEVLKVNTSYISEELSRCFSSSYILSLELGIVSKYNIGEFIRRAFMSALSIGIEGKIPEGEVTSKLLGLASLAAQNLDSIVKKE